MEIEITRAQALLVELIQVLGPLASKEGMQSDKSTPQFFEGRVFVPPFLRGQWAPFPYSVRLLNTLESAQSEMSNWLEPKSEALEKDPKGKEKGGAESEKATSLKEPGTKNQTTFKGRFSDPSQKLMGKPFEKFLGKSPLAPSRQARELIEQVRGAIRMLTTSSNFNKPEIALFQKAMEGLKPLVDDLILVVEKKEFLEKEIPVHSSNRPIPVPSREVAFRKQIAFPMGSTCGNGERMDVEKTPTSLEKKRTFHSPPIQTKDKAESTREKKIVLPKPTFSDRDKISPDKMGPPSTEKEKQLFKLLQNGNFLPLDQKQELRREEKAFELRALLGAPYTSEKSPFSKSSKNKKRKNVPLWQDDEKEETKDTDPG